MEKKIKPVRILAFILAMVCFTGVFFAHYQFSKEELTNSETLDRVILMLTAVFLLKGLTIVNRISRLVCAFFGKYSGTVRNNGLSL
jgi:hypothetical protein